MRSAWPEAAASAGAGASESIATLFDASAGIVTRPVIDGGTMPRTSRGRPASHQAPRIGLILNRRAHRNLSREMIPPERGAIVDWAVPGSQSELADTLARFGAQRIDTLIVDGGDGTVRDVLTAAATRFPHGQPRLAIVPSGKTNALAVDLGVPAGWTIADAVAASAAERVALRAPIEITREGDEASLRGFLFGAGAFVKATGIAQDAHRLGAFRSLAVGLSLGAAVTQTMFANRSNPWRRGEAMTVRLPGREAVTHPFYLMLASTLERLPLGLKPFGKVRPGLKLLGIDAPPRHMLASVPALLAGSEAGWLASAGYHRADAGWIGLTLASKFILDGEAYPGGALTIRRGNPVIFAVP